MQSPILSSLLQGIQMHLPEPQASLLQAVTYGVPLSLQKDLHTAIIKSGVVHVVVLSGANLTLLTRLTERVVSTLESKYAIITHLLLLLGFIGVVGLEPPLWRAFCMFLLDSICMFTGRPSYQLWNLFLTIFITSIVFPAWMSSISFYLSCVATFGIILSAYCEESYDLHLSPLVKTMFESWIILICTLPITWIVFKSISIISPLSTMLVNPLILPMMLLGMAISIAHIIFPPFAILLTFPALGATSLFLLIIQLCTKIPFGYIKFN